MTLADRIARLNQLADAAEAQAVSADTARRIAREAQAWPDHRRAVSTYGFHFNDEGAETAYSGVEKVTVPAELPSKEVAWELKHTQSSDTADAPNIRYRVQIETAGPCTVSATDARGVSLMRDKTVLSSAVFDLASGSVRLRATDYVLRLRVVRYTERAEGEIILGPFDADGLVTARAIGHGSFTCEVASDYHTEAGVSPSTSPVWRAPAPGIGDAGSEATLERGLPWSVRRLTAMGLEAPRWSESVRAGLSALESELVVYDEPQVYDGASYWAGVGEWAVVAPDVAPEFDAVPRYYAYVWGRIELDPETPTLVEAYDLVTGRPGSPLVEGAWLVKTTDPSALRVVGHSTLYGEPLRAESDPLAHPLIPTRRSVGGVDYVPAGTYHRAETMESPSGVLVRVRGRGILRAIELRVEATATSPGAGSVVDVRREDLRRYWAAADDPRPVADTTGRGTFNPA
jgi:hypothetical protein